MASISIIVMPIWGNPYPRLPGLLAWRPTRSREPGLLPSSRIPSSVFSLAIPGSWGLEEAQLRPWGVLPKQEGNTLTMSH
jgi:hypothetical protein